METFYRALDVQIDLERSRKGNPILSGELAVFNEWTEIRSPLEGHFMERIAPTAFNKTIADRMSRIRVLFQHGRDPSTGSKPLGKILDMPRSEHALRYDVELFNADYVERLLPALEAGQYGSSFSARDIKSTEVRRPKQSDYNPEGISEVTRDELMLREFGPVTFPAYESASAGLRSVTDEFVHPGLLELLELVGVQRAAAPAAPPEEEEPEAEPDQPAEEDAPSEEEEASRSTQEAETSTEEEEPPSWLLTP